MHPANDKGREVGRGPGDEPQKEKIREIKPVRYGKALVRNTITVSWKTTDWEKLYKSKEKAICRREEAYYGEKIYTIQKKIHSAGMGRITETTIAQQIFYLSHNHSLDGTYNGCKRHTLLH